MNKNDSKLDEENNEIEEKSHETNDGADIKLGSVNSEDQRTPHRFTYYVVLCASFFAFAFYMNIIGSTLDDLSKQLNCPVEQIYIALMARTLVNFLVGVSATFTIHFFNRQLQLIFHFVTYALASACVPYLTSIHFFYVQSIVTGCSMAYINAIIIQWTIELYSNNPKKLKLYIQLLFLMFPAASFVSLNATAPFLSKKLENSTQSESTSEESKIWVPFFISAVLSILCALVIGYMFITKPYKPKERRLDDKDRQRLHLAEEDASPIPRKFYILVTALFLSCYAFQLGQESNTMYYTQHFLLKTSLGLTKSSAAYVASIIYATYGLGRFINIFISMKISITLMIYFNIFMMLLANTMIFFFIEYSLWITYVSFAILGFSYSSMVPALLTFFENRLNQTMKVSTLMVASGTTVATVNHLIVGKIIEKDYNIYRTMSLIYATIFACVFISLHSTDLLKIKLLKKKQIVGIS